MATKTKPPVNLGAASKEPWHAVSVMAGLTTCPAAEGLRGQRFLADEAPRLPLLECSLSVRCTCIYRHFSDRRHSPRRETDRGMFPRPRMGEERRELRGRRSSDDANL